MLAHNPDLEGLLHEIAADPRSHLLRVERPDVYASLRDRQTAVSHRATGLTSPERELLRSYRYEAAYLLRETCVALLTETSGDIFDRGEGLDSQPSLRPTSERQRDLVAAAEGMSSVTAASSASFKRLISSLAGASVSRVATASLRLLPTDQARIYIGQHAIARRQPLSALACFREVLGRRPRPTQLNEVFARTNAGCAFFQLDRIADALKAYRGAALQGELRLESAVGWLISAVQLGSRAEVLGSAHLLDDRLGPDHPNLVLFLQRDSRRRARGIWRPSDSARRFVQDIAGGLGQTSRRILDEVYA